MYTIKELENFAKSICNNGGIVPKQSTEKSENKDQFEVAKNITNGKVRELEAFCPIGGKFNYLGVTFVVVHHATRKVMGYSPVVTEAIVVPALIAHYYNKVSGKVEKKVFTEHEAKAIIVACEGQ